MTYSGKSCALTVTSGTHITLPSLSFFTCKMGINKGSYLKRSLRKWDDVLLLSHFSCV